MSSVGPVLAVKHAVPPPRTAVVPRPRLVRRLDAAAGGTGAADADGTWVCVVVAPAGWGKTTLLSQWATAPERAGRVAWVSLDPSDDEPVRFWTYVATALRALDDDLGAAALAALRVPGVDPVAVAVPLLLNELSAAHGRWVLVLDDYHVIGDRAVHEGVEFLVTYLPPSLRLVVASRADPSLPLARLRARGDLTELRADELRLSAAESQAVLTQVAGIDLPASDADAVWLRTEGWAAGVQLAALAVRESSGRAVPADLVRGDDRHVLDYLSAEVLDRLDASQRELLVRTSFLDRLSGPLCDAVLERTGTREVLVGLERRSLFVVPADRRRHWYRCHGLLRDVLRQELDASPDAAVLVPALQRRAATWYAAQGQVDEAVRLLVEARDAAAATALLQASEEWFFGGGRAAQYLRLGEQVADVGAVDAPDVLVLLAYAAVLCGRFDRVGHWCDAADRAVTDSTRLDGWTSARACVLTLRAAYGPAEARDPALAVTQGAEAARLESDAGEPGYVVARFAQASALMRAERDREAVAVLADAWSRPVRAELPLPVVLQGGGLYALCLWQSGSHDDAREVVLEVAARADAAEQAWAGAAAASTTWLRLVQGRLAHRDGDAVVGQERLRRAVELAEVWGRDTDLVMALTSLAEAQLPHDAPAARSTLTRAREVADGGPVRPPALRALEAVEARVGRGAVRAARRRGQLAEELTDRELSILRALAGAATQREIGDALFLSVNTVKGYTKSLYRKLGTASRQETVAQARALGLL